MARFVETVADTHRIKLLVGEPDGAGPHPGLLLAFHREGFSSFAQEVVHRFASAGYLIVAPDLYFRTGGVPWQEAVKQRRDDHVLSAMASGLAWLKARLDVDVERITVAGHCMGGRIAFMVAGTWPDEFRACLSYYGGGMFIPWGGVQPPFDLLKAVRCPVAGFFGNDDDNPSPADVERIAAELTRHGIHHEFHRFDGAGHGYMYRESPDYRAGPAEESWSLSFEFLSRHDLAPNQPRMSA